MSKVQQLADSIEAMQRKLDAIKKLPEDDSWADNGSMIMFKRTFPGSDAIYTYVGIKQNGVWWITTRQNMRSNMPMVWDGFIEWLGSRCIEMWHLEISHSLMKEKE